MLILITTSLAGRRASFHPCNFTPVIPLCALDQIGVGVYNIKFPVLRAIIHFGGPVTLATYIFSHSVISIAATLSIHTMSNKAVIPFLVGMMLLTGVCNTILNKYQVRTALVVDISVFVARPLSRNSY